MILPSDRETKWWHKNTSANDEKSMKTKGKMRQMPGPCKKAEKLWNIKVAVISIVVGAFVIVPNNLDTLVMRSKVFSDFTKSTKRITVGHWILTAGRLAKSKTNLSLVFIDMNEESLRVCADRTSCKVGSLFLCVCVEWNKGYPWGVSHCLGCLTLRFYCHFTWQCKLVFSLAICHTPCKERLKLYLDAYKNILNRVANVLDFLVNED